MRARSLIALFSSLFLSATAHADDAVRIERRSLVKDGHLFLTGGVGWLARGDYYDSPAFTLNATVYPREWGGLDAQVSVFHTTLNAGGTEVFQRFGEVPDAQQPRLLLLAGWRQSLGYGKVALGENPSKIIHFDWHASLHAGGLLTDKALNPAAQASVGFLAQVTPMLYVVTDVAFIVSREVRSTSSVACGVFPQLAVGARL